MVDALCFSTNFPFNTANNDDRNAEETPKMIPLMYLYSVLMMIETPIITMIPNIISYQIIFRL